DDLCRRIRQCGDNCGIAASSNGMPHETVTSDKKFPLGRDFLSCRKPPSLKVLALLLLHASNGPAMRVQLCELLHIGFCWQLLPFSIFPLGEMEGFRCAGSSSMNIKSSIRRIKKRFVAGFGLILLLERYCWQECLHLPCSSRLTNPGLLLSMQCVRKATSPQRAPLRYPAVRARDVVRRRIDLDVDAPVALGPIDRARFCRTDTWTNHRGGSGGGA